MRIVIFRTDKIGDLIVSTPVLSAIKAKHPHARIMLVVSPYNAVAAQGLPHIDQLLVHEHREKTLADIRAFAPTHVIVLSPKLECYTLSKQCGAQALGWIEMAYRKFQLFFMRPWFGVTSETVTQTSAGLHHSEHALNLVRRMGLAAHGDYPYLIARDEKARGEIQRMLAEKGITRPYVAVHLVDKWIEENWAAEDVKALLAMIKAKLNVEIVACAGPADKELANALEEHFPVLRSLEFGQWAALLDGAKLVISPDCAAVHMACALKKPLIALYQPSRFEKAMSEYGPRFTDFRAHALSEPKKLMPFLFRDACDLLGFSHF